MIQFYILGQLAVDLEFMFSISHHSVTETRVHVQGYYMLDWVKLRDVRAVYRCFPFQLGKEKRDERSDQNKSLIDCRIGPFVVCRNALSADFCPPFRLFASL